MDVERREEWVLADPVNRSLGRNLVGMDLRLVRLNLQ